MTKKFGYGRDVLARVLKYVEKTYNFVWQRYHVFEDGEPRIVSHRQDCVSLPLLVFPGTLLTPGTRVDDQSHQKGSFINDVTHS